MKKRQKIAVHPAELSTGIPHVVVRRGEGGNIHRIDLVLSDARKLFQGDDSVPLIQSAPMGRFNLELCGEGLVFAKLQPLQTKSLFTAYYNPTYRYSSVNGCVIQGDSAAVAALFQQLGVEAKRCAAFPIVSVAHRVGFCFDTRHKVPLRAQRQVDEVVDDLDSMVHPRKLYVKLTLQSEHDNRKPTLHGAQLPFKLRTSLHGLRAGEECMFEFDRGHGVTRALMHKSRDNDWYANNEWSGLLPKVGAPVIVQLNSVTFPNGRVFQF